MSKCNPIIHSIGACENKETLQYINAKFIICFARLPQEHFAYVPNNPKPEIELFNHGTLASLHLNYASYAVLSGLAQGVSQRRANSHNDNAINISACVSMWILADRTLHIPNKAKPNISPRLMHNSSCRNCTRQHNVQQWMLKIHNRHLNNCKL